MFFALSNQIYARQYDVLGIGAPCIDIILPVDDEFLQAHQLQKGASIPVDWEFFRQLLTEGNCQEEHIATGGCTSNTLKGLARLGQSCQFFGKIGSDAVADKVIETMEAHGIATKFLPAVAASQQVLGFITPDHERSFCVHHGAANELSEADLYPELFENVKMVYIEGYQLPNGQLVEMAIKMAKAAGAQVCLDLGTHLLVNSYKDRLYQILKDVNIIFANSEEAFSLTGKAPEESCDILRNICDIAVVLTGGDGCWVGDKNQKIHCPAFQVEVLDTTGAGDLFASGFIHAYLSKCSLADCGRFGNLLGSTIIQYYGAEIPVEKWDAIRSQQP